MELFQTSINMNDRIYKQLEQLSKKTDLNKKEIIIFVIMNFQKNTSIPENFTNNNRYQPVNNKWKKLRICFNETEREITYDLRKLYKLSLSFIVALSLMLYSHLLLNSLYKGSNFKKSMYKYTTITYDYSVKSTNNDIIITFIWKNEQKQE